MAVERSGNLGLKPQACEEVTEHQRRLGSAKGLQPQVARWLTVCAVLVFAMIVVGGITRVTRSGLSITTWDPVVGMLPPMSDAAWGEAFSRYQASPEGTLVNAGISLGDFRSLYLVEYGHRLLGRITGLVLFVPLVIFGVRGDLGMRRARSLLIVLAAGAFQGVLGWYMVSSGLVDAPHVSPFRLAGHLSLGMMLLGALVWNAIPKAPGDRAPRAALAATTLAIAVGAIAIAFGALMAAYHAGLFCSTFPTMNGAWLPPALVLSARGLVTDAWTVHFVHRLLAMLVAICVAFVCIAWRHGTRRQRRLSIAAMTCVAIQITLGACVVAWHVPATLAVIHQANAALLVVLLVALLREAWSAAVPPA